METARGQSDLATCRASKLTYVAQAQSTKLQGNSAHLLASRLSDYLIISKPRITIAVIASAYVGFAMGLETVAITSQAQWITLIGLLIGTALSCIGSGVFNQIYERNTDIYMVRTENRPIATRRVGLGEAITLGAVLSLAGILILWLSSNWIAALLSLVTIVIYAAIYTPLKRVTSWATAVGAVPGALPPVIGYVAATGHFDAICWLLFAIMFMWQFPHFFSISWVYRNQYANAGLQMLSVVDPGGLRTFRQIAISCFTLIPLGMLPTLLGKSGMVYFFTAIFSGIIFLALALLFTFSPTRKHARTLFFASLIYLPLILTVMIFDQ